jgi:hypothetical protein
MRHLPNRTGIDHGAWTRCSPEGLRNNALKGCATRPEGLRNNGMRMRLPAGVQSTDELLRYGATRWQSIITITYVVGDCW